jgi:hypothetical protein
MMTSVPEGGGGKNQKKKNVVYIYRKNNLQNCYFDSVHSVPILLFIINLFFEGRPISFIEIYRY